MSTSPLDHHRVNRLGWLRAAVLGANDGIVSTTSLVLGVAAAGSERSNILIAGVAALVAGAMSMAAGELVSVSSQADTEQADLEQERRQHREDRDGEQAELAAIYEQRGLTPDLAGQVAEQLMAHGALAAHARDELGITEHRRARPVQAALASAAAFAVGATPPLLMVVVVPIAYVLPLVGGASLICLASLGAVAAAVGGASPGRGALRVSFWGALAMVLTAAIGAWFGTLI